VTACEPFRPGTEHSGNCPQAFSDLEMFAG
jgi:hypothetical protein